MNKKEMSKREIIINFFSFAIGFFGLGIIIILSRILENQFVYNYDFGILFGFIEGIFLTISLLFLAKYQKIKEGK